MYTGWRLIDVKATKQFFEFSKFEAFIYIATIFSIVTINLLYGVMIGYALSLVYLIYKLNHFEAEAGNKDDKVEIKAHGVATFLSLPKFSKMVDESMDSGKSVILDFSQVRYVDTATREYIENLKENSSGKIEYVS